MNGLLTIVAALLVVAGICLVVGFWPVALILGGLALFAFANRENV